MSTTQCEKAITTEKRKAQEAEARQLQLEARWTEAWSIAEQRQVSFGRPGEGWRHPPQLESPLPFYADHEGGDLLGKDQWPIVVLYPQHRQLDVIQGVDPTTMLVMLLAEMFPEPEDEGGTGRPAAAVHWDCNQEYFVSNLVVYIHLSSCAKFKNCEEWLEYNRQAAKRGYVDIGTHNITYGREEGRVVLIVHLTLLHGQDFALAC